MDGKLKAVTIRRNRKCCECGKKIHKGPWKVLSTGFAWFCSMVCYNDWETRMMDARE